MDASHRLLRAARAGGMVLLAACGTSGPSDPASELASLEPPAECALPATPTGSAYPDGPYGIEVGERFEPFTLPDCDGAPLSFEEILGDAELVLFNLGAGWCESCVTESRTLDAEVFRRFCPGLRVVQVLFQDDEGRIPTSLFCNDWRRELRLSFPVLKDQLGQIKTRHLEDAASQTPVNMLVDRDAVIRFKSMGTVPSDLPDRISSLLAP